MQEEMHELRTQAKTFAQKECTLCNKKLALPSIHFMCGHTFHDYCVESNGDHRRQCPKCQGEFTEVVERRMQLAE